MKRAEIKNCLLCGKVVAHNNDLTFYRVSITRLILNPRAIQQRQGLEMMLGSPALAEVMGPDDDLANEFSSHDFLVCQPCALGSHCIAEMDERAGEDKEAANG